MGSLKGIIVSLDEQAGHDEGDLVDTEDWVRG